MARLEAAAKQLTQELSTIKTKNQTLETENQVTCINLHTRAEKHTYSHTLTHSLTHSLTQNINEKLFHGLYWIIWIIYI